MSWLFRSSLMDLQEYTIDGYIIKEQTMSNFLTKLLGGILEASYAQTGDINVSDAKGATEALGVKLLLIKGISQDLGSTAAVTFLQKNDTALGPIAQQVVNAVNGNATSALTVVLGLLTSIPSV